MAGKTGLGHQKTDIVNACGCTNVWYECLILLEENEKDDFKLALSTIFEGNEYFSLCGELIFSIVCTFVLKDLFDGSCSWIACCNLEIRKLRDEVVGSCVP